MEKKNQQISRNTYKRIKSMDRVQLPNYITQIYLTGFEAGRKAGTPDVLFRTIRELLLDTEDIGPTRAEAIMKKLGGIFTPQASEEPTEETAGTPAESAGNAEEAGGNAEQDQHTKPQRPIMKEKGEDKVLCCPSCEHPVKLWVRDDRESAFCFACGQALDLKPVCYNCENYFESCLCGYNECRCKVYGSLDAGQKERHPDTAAASCESYTPRLEERA